MKDFKLFGILWYELILWVAFCAGAMWFGANVL